MKINFFKATELEKSIRLAVHRSGKLGFSKEAEEKLNLSKNKSVGIGTNAEDETDQNLYMVTYEGEPDDAFKVGSAGGYYYVNTKVLFDNLKIDYKDGQVAFDMTKIEVDGQPIYKLERVIKPKRKEETKDQTKTNDMEQTES